MGLGLNHDWGMQEVLTGEFIFITKPVLRRGKHKAVLTPIHYHLGKVNRPLTMACLKDWIWAPGAVTHPGRELRKAARRLEGWSYLKAKPEWELAIKHVIVSFLWLSPSLLSFAFQCTLFFFHLFNVESDSSTADKPQASYWQRNSKSIMVCWLLLN